MHDQDYQSQPRRRRSRRDDYYSDEDTEQSRGSHRGSLYSKHHRIEEWARRGDTNRTPEIRIDGVLHDESHIYPPPPTPMVPPYPTTGALIPMPPDAPYLQRSHSDQPSHSRELTVRKTYSDRALTRSRSAHDVGRGHDRGWHDNETPRGYLNDNDHDGRKFSHVTAGLAGALAGGYLGKKVSKGDTIATVAGALVGALGASVVEREWERQQRRDKEEDDVWKHGRYRY